jgi:hypothetical protein
VLRFQHLRGLLLLLVSLAASIGCGAKSREAFNKQTSHVHAIAAQYVRASSKLHHLPQNEVEFKRALADLNVPLQALKVNSIDELFISERDGEPLVVVYGTPPKNSDVVVYEKTGIDGKRYVGHMSGMIEELGDEELRKAVAEKN